MRGKSCWGRVNWEELLADGEELVGKMRWGGSNGEELMGRS